MRKIVEAFLILITEILFSKFSFAQDQAETFTDKIFKPNIHTVQLYVEPLVLTDPVISLNGTAQLHLGFDDLEGQKKEYYFTVIQCNYDWSPSELSHFDYISGFNEQEIRDYQFSYNTNQTFTHYAALFPNADFRITKSGNYILKVYEDDNPDDVVLTRRFMVVNNLVEITSDIKQADDVRYDRTYQQVHFNILHHGMDISNSFSEINVLLMQNFRWDNAITNLQPQFVRPDQLDYTHTMKTSFPAGKEFRYFDTRTIRYNTDRVKEISEDKNTAVVTLFPDQSRGTAQSFSRKDINGKFIPGTQDYADEDVRADYVWVKFSLPVDYPFKNGKIFLLGKLTDWQLQDAYRLQYNAATKAYEATLYLKQGYYEYEYYFDSEEKDTDDDPSSLLEGNSYETENAYQILVYYRPFGSRYDQVIGYKTTDTFNR
ncbi:MAG TPA: DUF5103 domain-containing protein [Chitinophagales bacterium]|nr:DUF5103 domain-containing protein [Chitinophagales bacterium]